VTQLSRQHLQHVLAVALTAAVESGEYFEARRNVAKQVKIKSSPADVVTEVDTACEDIIRRHIEAAFPTHDILGEESTAAGATASIEAAAAVAKSTHLWIVDPLDGTTNFVYSIPLSVVSIAYAVQGEVVAGAIYDPYHGEAFFGAKGLGCYRASAEQTRLWSQHVVMETNGNQELTLPGELLQPSQVKTPELAVMATGFPSRAFSRQSTHEVLLSLADKMKSMRALGAAALHLAYVAAGRIDVFFEYDLNAWDLAAGVFLVTESGGVACELQGHAYHLQVRNVVAAGQQELIDVVEESLLTARHMEVLYE